MNGVKHISSDSAAFRYCSLRPNALRHFSSRRATPAEREKVSKRQRGKGTKRLICCTSHTRPHLVGAGLAVAEVDAAATADHAPDIVRRILGA